MLLEKGMCLRKQVDTLRWECDVYGELRYSREARVAGGHEGGDMKGGQKAYKTA